MSKSLLKSLDALVLPTEACDRRLCPGGLYVG